MLYNQNEIFNNSSELVFDKNPKEIFCQCCNLTELILNDNLITLFCFNNQLSELTLNDKLEWLSCDMNVDVNNINNNELIISFYENSLK